MWAYAIITVLVAIGIGAQIADYIRSERNIREREKKLGVGRYSSEPKTSTTR